MTTQIQKLLPHLHYSNVSNRPMILLYIVRIDPIVSLYLLYTTNLLIHNLIFRMEVFSPAIK